MYSTHFLDYYIYKVENGQEVDSPAPKQIKKKWNEAFGPKMEVLSPRIISSKGYTKGV